MGIVSIIRQRRRPVVLGTLVVLLHAALFSLVGNGVALPRLPAGLPAMQFVQAKLLPDAARAPVSPDPLPAPGPLPPPPLPDVLPALAQEPAPALADDAIAPEVDPASGGVGQGPPMVPAPAQAAAGTPLQAEATPAEAKAEAVVEPRSYQASMPPPAAITMDVARIDRDGTRWSGEALLSWQLANNTYRIEYEAGIRVVFTRVNLAVLTSEGSVSPAGFAPVKMTEKRRGRALTATHFDREQGKISFSGSQKTFPLAPGAQDKASLPLQLAAIARGDPAQLSGDIDIQVGEERDAAVFRFVVVGQEEIDTKLGRLQAVHLSRPPKAGSYRSRLDIWLAPSRGWLPVRIRSTEANGAVTTQTVNNIVLTATGK